MDERLRFVAKLLDGEAMTDVCREFGISRKTGYKIFHRYKESGFEGTQRSMSATGPLRQPAPDTDREPDRHLQAGEAALGGSQDPRVVGSPAGPGRAPGLYEYKMEMDMGAIPGAPKGMGKQTMSVQHCLTEKDIQDGQLGRKDPNSKVDCKITDMKMSGNTANYKFACTGEMSMTSDNTVTFVPDGYRMVSKMTMNSGGQTMNMVHNSQAKYLGACKK